MTKYYVNETENHEELASLLDAILAENPEIQVYKMDEEEEEGTPNPEKMRKKITILEEENVFLAQKVAEATETAIFAMQQVISLREEIKGLFAELSKREERTIEKNTVRFENERTGYEFFKIVKQNDLKNYRKDKKVDTFNYAMKVEQSQVVKWNKN